MTNIGLIMVNDLVELSGNNSKTVFRVTDKKGNVVYSHTGDEYELDDSMFQGSWPTPEGEIIHVFLN